MSNIDKRALREAAEKATPGRIGDRVDGSIKYTCRGTDGTLVLSTDNHDDYGFVGDNSLEDELFFRLCDPVTVLALLDELEPMALAHLNLNLLCDVYRTAYEEARHDGLVNWEAAASLAEENGDLKRKLEAAEKRIGELDARYQPKFVQCWLCKHDIEVLAIADCDGYCPRCAAPIDLDDEPYAAAGKGG